MRLQRIRQRRILNTSVFGRTLQSFARSHTAQFSAQTGYEFHNGGCLMFATALQDWSDGQLCLRAFIRAAEHPFIYHVAAAYDVQIKICLDCDGLGTEDDVFEKYRRLDLLDDLRSYDVKMPKVIPVSGDIGGIPYDDALVANLTQQMRLTLGAFHPDCYLT